MIIDPIQKIIRRRWWNPFFWIAIALAMACCFVVMLTQSLWNAAAESAKLGREVIGGLRK